MSEYDNEETEIHIPSDEEYWEAYSNSQGVDRADILLQLSMSYCPERAGQPVITMSEVAIEMYKESGYTEQDLPDFAFCYAEIAEHKSKITDYSGAIEAARKALPLLQLHKIENYDELKWNLVKWLVILGKAEEARTELNKLISDYAEQALWNS